MKEALEIGESLGEKREAEADHPTADWRRNLPWDAVILDSVRDKELIAELKADVAA